MRLEESPLLQALFTKDWLELVFLLTLLAILDYIKIVIDEKKKCYSCYIIAKKFSFICCVHQILYLWIAIVLILWKTKNKKKIQFSRKWVCYVSKDLTCLSYGQFITQLPNICSDDEYILDFILSYNVKIYQMPAVWIWFASMN